MSEENPTTLKEYIQHHINRSPYNYQDLAVLAGFTSADPIYMLSHGETKVPFEIIPKLAGALSCNVSEMLMMKMQEIFTPDLFQAVKESFEPEIPPANDIEWLTCIRQYFHGALPPLNMQMMQTLEKAIPKAYPDKVTSTVQRAIKRQVRQESAE
jgi:hypothetical protein